MSNDFTGYSCGPIGLVGDDALTMFMLFQSCDVTVTMTHVTPESYDPVLLLLSGPSAGQCLAYVDDGGPGENETLTVTGLVPGTYYVVVDALAGCGAWDLALTLGACASPTPAQVPSAGPAGLLLLIVGLGALLRLRGRED